MLRLNRLASGPPPGLDQTSCEREQIHIPDAIQPHGALLAMLAESRIITHASANLFDFLGQEPDAALGQPVEQILGDAAKYILTSVASGDDNVIQPLADPHGQRLRFHAFRTGRHIVVDIQPIYYEPEMKSPMTAVQAVLGTFGKATTRSELYQAAITGLQAISGYDRVMVYQFGDQGIGEIVAEVHAAHLEPYLGHHYPTTDIPAQARRMLVRQRIGSVADSSYQPVPLLSDARFDDGEKLDLSDSNLRSVSPIHCEYMRNMGTGASLSIGLISGSHLMGVLLCHHSVARIAGPDLRAAADMIGRVVSLLVVSLGEAELYAERNARSSTLNAVVRMLAVPLPLESVLMAAEFELLRLLDATGAVVRLDGKLLNLGTTPPPAAAAELLKILEATAAGLESKATSAEAKEAGGLVAMDDVALTHPELAGCVAHGSGALLLPLAQAGEDLILWFRPELSRVVTWAGNPGVHTPDPVTGQILPRASFAAWKQTTSGRSKPWTDADLALAADFRRAFQDEVAKRARVELSVLRQFEEQNRALEIRIAQRTKELEEETSERLRAEDNLTQRHKMEAIGQLTGGVAHDFNNVLAAVLGNLELAEAATAEPLTLRLLGRARSATERGAKLTGHLLSFARKQPLSRTTCDVNRLIKTFHGLIGRTIGSRILITLDLASDLWPVIADPVQFEMVLLNITVNARDAMPNGGMMTIQTSNSPALSAGQPGDLPAGDYTRISVRDTGVGMGEEIMRKVFEPFFTTKKVGEGTGLGLSQVYGFCKQVGGSVSLSSEIGSGTTVDLFLPRTAALNPGLPVQETLESRKPLAAPAPLRALVVDDDPDVLEITAEMLQMLGFEVVTASSGVHGVQILESSTHVDILVTDFSMPAMTGLEFIRHARTSKPGLPCLLVTGFADIGNFAEAAAEKVTVLRKPYGMKDLAANIASIQKATALAGQINIYQQSIFH